jgi:hypothetical protein
MASLLVVPPQNPFRDRDRVTPHAIAKKGSRRLVLLSKCLEEEEAFIEVEVSIYASLDRLLL